MAHRTISYSAVVGFAALLGTSAQAALVISSDATSNVTCSAGVCSATANDAVLNVTDLTTMLAAGSLTVQSGSTAQDILVEAPFSWTSSNTLTLDSYRAITVDQPVSDAGPAALNIANNDGGTGGELLFRFTGRISFTSTKNKLSINGQKYTLLADIASMASAIAGDPSGSYALKDNYDAGKDGIYDLTPITTNFSGTFDGLGNTISNLSIDCRLDKFHISIGLFNQIVPAGAVKSLRLANISYKVKTRRAEGAGGIAGGSSGYMFDDHVTGKITAIVGVGGLVEANEDGTISNSSASVRIASATGVSGGLAGSNDGTITTSYAVGDVNGSGAAGLVDSNYGEGSVANSYATGRIEGGDSGLVGGFAGENDGGTIESSYSIGHVTAQGKFGGFVGSFDGEGASNDYWDIQTSGTSNGTDQGNFSGITGLKTKQFKSGLPAGFDPSVWAQDKKINHGYPYLINNPPSK